MRSREIVKGGAILGWLNREALECSIDVLLIDDDTALGTASLCTKLGTEAINVEAALLEITAILNFVPEEIVSVMLPSCMDRCSTNLL